MIPPDEEQHYCNRCNQPLRYIDEYGAWYCYVCQTYETPDVEQSNICSTCSQPLTYLEPYSAWYCYTCEKYEMPQAQSGGYSNTSTYDYQQQLTCSTCGRELSAGQCYYCLADDIIRKAETALESARKIGASVGKIEEKIHAARRFVEDDRPDMAIEEAEKAEETAKEVRDSHKSANKMINTLEDDLDKLAQFDINTSTADNQLQLARNFIRSGNYEKAIEFLTKAQDFADNAAIRAGIKEEKKTVRQPRYSTDYPACPDCGNVVPTDKELCPYCEAPLYEEISVEEAAKRSRAKSPSFDKTSSIGTLISEKDVGKTPIVEGSEIKSSGPAEKVETASPPEVTKTQAGSEPVEKVGICPSCKEEVEADWAKCPFCSTDLKARPAPAPAKPKPAPPSIAPKPEVQPQHVQESMKCSSCGSEIEAGWKRCPVCMTPIKMSAPTQPPKPLARPKPPPPPADTQPVRPPVTMQPAKPPGTAQPANPPQIQKPPPPPPTDPPQAMPPPPPPPSVSSPKEKAEQEIKEIEVMVLNLDDKGVNTAHAKNLIRLAQSFIKGGSYDKAQRYIRKARQAASELK